jgi:hypothetical protein
VSDESDSLDFNSFASNLSLISQQFFALTHRSESDFDIPPSRSTLFFNLNSQLLFAHLSTSQPPPERDSVDMAMPKTIAKFYDLLNAFKISR